MRRRGTGSCYEKRMHDRLKIPPGFRAAAVEPVVARPSVATSQSKLGFGPAGLGTETFDSLSSEVVGRKRNDPTQRKPIMRITKRRGTSEIGAGEVPIQLGKLLPCH